MTGIEGSGQAASPQIMDNEKRGSSDPDIPLRELINTTGSAMGILNDDGLVIVANDRLCDMAGLSREEIEGKVTWTQFVPEDDLKRIAKYHKMRSEGVGDPPTEYDFKFKRINGDIIHAGMHISMISSSKLRIFSIIDKESDHRMKQELLEREEHLNQKLKEQRKVQEILFQITTDPKIIEGDLESGIRPITELLSDLMQVGRVSVWALKDSDRILECIDLFEYPAKEHSNGAQLLTEKYPRYFQALKDNPVIDASDAAGDERTNEFNDGYLDRMDIVSMMDTGIWTRGELIGAICIESIGKKREWTMEELRLAYEIADHVSIMFMSQERKEAERHLKDMKDFNESLINSITDGIIIEDKDGFISFANPAMSKLVGSPRGVLEGSHWTDIVPPDQRDRVKEANQRRKEGKIDSYEVELLRSDGNRTPVLVSGVPNFTGGIFDGLLAIFTDIREQKRIQNDLALRKAHFQDLYENLPEAVVIVDNKGMVKQINNEFTNLFGYKEDECIGKNLDKLIVPESIRDHGIKLTRETSQGNRKDEEIQRIKKDGSLVDVSLVSAPIFVDGQCIGLYAIYRDISMRKFAEKALLEERNRSEFYLDLLSHDIGNLHQGIFTALQIASMKGWNEKDGRNAFETALELVERSIHLVKNVIFLANIDSRKVSKERIDVVSTIENVLSHVTKLFPGKKISIELDLPKDPVYIEAEEIVEELFFNILHNGLKFQRDERAVIGVRVRRDEEDKRVIIEMYDHGPGILQEKKDQMFQRFEKGGSLSHMGLGLSLVKALTKLYGGNIQVKDRVEGVREWGTNFIVDLPLADE